MHGISLTRILEWVSISFSKGSPRDLSDLGIDRTHVSYIGRRFFTIEPPGKSSPGKCILGKEEHICKGICSLKPKMSRIKELSRGMGEGLREKKV